MQPFKSDKLHLQVQEHLRDLISGGSYRPGDQLPSEVELAAQLGVSRPTLREALLHLEQEGTIIRRHGVGTFVSTRRPVFDSGLEVLESLGRQAHRKGMNTQVVDLRVAERDPSADELAKLELPSESRARVLSVDRVIALEGQRIAHLLDVVPLARLRQDELGEAFSGSVLDVLLTRASPAPAWSRTEIMAEAAGQQAGQMLGIPPGTALLKLVAQLYGSDDQVLDYSSSLFVPGFFRFHVMRRVGSG